MLKKSSCFKILYQTGKIAVKAVRRSVYLCLLRYILNTNLTKTHFSRDTFSVIFFRLGYQLVSCLIYSNIPPWRKLQEHFKWLKKGFLMSCSRSWPNTKKKQWRSVLLLSQHLKCNAIYTKIHSITLPFP